MLAAYEWLIILCRQYFYGKFFEEPVLKQDEVSELGSPGYKKSSARVCLCFRSFSTLFLKLSRAPNKPK